MPIHIRDYSTGYVPAEEEEQWTTAEATAAFTFHSFAAPFVICTRKSDGVRGTLQFNHSPRVYFGFEADDAS